MEGEFIKEGSVIPWNLSCRFGTTGFLLCMDVDFVTEPIFLLVNIGVFEYCTCGPSPIILFYILPTILSSFAGPSSLGLISFRPEYFRFLSLGLIGGLLYEFYRLFLALSEATGYLYLMVDFD